MAESGQPRDAQHLDFPTERFDSVVGTLALCTIPDDRRALAEAWRVLRPGVRSAQPGAHPRSIQVYGERGGSSPRHGGIRPCSERKTPLESGYTSFCSACSLCLGTNRNLALGGRPETSSS